MIKVRVAAAKVIAAVLKEQASFATLIPKYQNQVAERERALLQELCYGTLRYYPRYELLLNHLLAKPFKAKDLDLMALLACGLYQLTETRIPAHAALSETVQAVLSLKKAWAKGLVNGVLRRFQREEAELCKRLATHPVFASAHPQWLCDDINSSWPEQAEAIFTANNSRPPMTLRVNRRYTDRNRYGELLANAGIAFKTLNGAPDAITLDKPLDVYQLPNFEQGWVSVQDQAAQLSASLLQLAPGQRVLDACCAPGGKTCHILEHEPELSELVAIDLEPERLERVKQNLSRLSLTATLTAADAADTSNWWDGKPFDRILLDAPCSATGVIRRHPDIKLLRRSVDIDKLAAVQLLLLDRLWPLLKPGGKLLYATCSILPRENDALIARFIAQQKDVTLLPINLTCGQATTVGHQLLPQLDGHDGFYYALLEKRPANGNQSGQEGL